MVVGSIGATPDLAYRRAPTWRPPRRQTDPSAPGHRRGARTIQLARRARPARPRLGPTHHESFVASQPLQSARPPMTPDARCARPGRARDLNQLSARSIEELLQPPLRRQKTSARTPSSPHRRLPFRNCRTSIQLTCPSRRSAADRASATAATEAGPRECNHRTQQEGVGCSGGERSWGRPAGAV